MRNERLEKLQAYRATLHPKKHADFDRRLQNACNAASASNSVTKATEHNQQVQGNLSDVQRRNAHIKELQDQNQQVLEGMAEALETQKGSLTCAQTLVPQVCELWLLALLAAGQMSGRETKRLERDKLSPSKNGL